MKKIAKNFQKVLKLKSLNTLAAFALVITVINANMGCVLFFHQPELPEGAKKLRKF